MLTKGFSAKAEQSHLRTSGYMTGGVGGLPPSGGAGGPPPTGGPPIRGDTIYGARAIADFIFNDAGDTARRRVFNLWAFYRDRHERAGFFKLKGGLCLSISRWRSFHGLD
jgi:hypothetical protein